MKSASVFYIFAGIRCHMLRHQASKSGHDGTKYPAWSIRCPFGQRAYTFSSILRCSFPYINTRMYKGNSAAFARVTALKRQASWYSSQADSYGRLWLYIYSARKEASPVEPKKHLLKTEKKSNYLMSSAPFLVRAILMGPQKLKGKVQFQTFAFSVPVFQGKKRKSHFLLNVLQPDFLKREDQFSPRPSPWQKLVERIPMAWLVITNRRIFQAPRTQDTQA